MKINHFFAIGLLFASLRPCYAQENTENGPTSAYGKYEHLLQTVECPVDAQTYGNYYDWGYWNGGAWCNQQTRPGYWVWVNPRWYVWANLAPTTDDIYQIAFFAYGAGKEFKNENGEVVHVSKTGHIFLGFYINGERIAIKGFSKGAMAPGTENSVVDESHLIRYHDDKFVTTVLKEVFYQAFYLRKDSYFLGYDDCVSYADEIADLIGLNTPVLLSDPADFSYPLWYLQYLKRNN